MSTHRVEIRATVLIHVHDDEVFTRIEEDDFKQSIGTYDSRQEVLEHFAFNAIANGVTDARSLDGWADLSPGVAIMQVEDVETEAVV